GGATLTNTTISGNATGGGSNSGPTTGGGKGATFTPAVNMIDGTVGENDATAAGSNTGLGQVNTSDAARTNTTISGNDDGVSSSGTTILHNTIVAGNTSSDLSGTGYSGSNNLIGAGGSGELTDGTDGNIVGVATADLHLAPLADNGGPTQTM